MSAVFHWSEANTISETVTDDIANLNFGDVDDVEIVVADYPIVAGNNSYQKYVKAKFTGTFDEISAMKFYMSAGALVSGETIMGAENVAFAEPSTDAEGGDEAVPTVVGSAWEIQGADGEDTIEAEGYTKYIRLQLRTTVGTPSGAVNTKTFTFQYDEV